MCWQQCGLLVSVDDGRVVKVEGDPSAITSGGYTCERAEAIPEFHYHPQRLNFPLKRAGERGEAKWQRISWDQAMDEIAERLLAIKRDFGPEAVGKIGGTLHGPADWACWRFFNLWGSPNVYNQGKNCGTADILMETAMYGWDTLGVSPKPGVTKTMFVWGANPPNSWMTKWNVIREAQRQGAKMVVIDPRLSETASFADVWVQPRPGTDAALAWGMIHVLVEEGLYDKEFVDKWCLGFEQIRERAKDYPPEKAAEITGISADKIVQLARLYADGPTCLVWGLATCHFGKAGQAAVHAWGILRAISGNLDREGGNPLTGPFNGVDWYGGIAWDAIVDNPERKRDCLTAERFPICSVPSLKRYNDSIKRAWGVGYGPSHYMIFPASRGFWDAIRYGEPYPLKALFIQTGNPLVILSGAKGAYEAMKAVDLSVGMDFFMTPSTALCDYVLPAADFLERPHLMLFWGVTTLAMATKQAMQPLYERRDDYFLWKELGNRVGQAGKWPENLEKMYDLFLKPSGMTLDQLASRDDNWLLPPEQYKRYEKIGFGTPSGKVELVPSLIQAAGLNPLPPYEEPSQSPIRTPEIAKDYPYQLISGSRIRPYWHSSFRQLKTLRWMHPYPEVQIHPETARKLGIADGDLVYIETPLGRVRQKARITEGIRPDVVHAEAYWFFPEEPEEEPHLFGVWDANINAIIPDDYDLCDYAGDLPFRAVMCNIYKAEPALATSGPFAVSVEEQGE
jgi:anaerobic selenocysteine-containing dehydrogenase